MSDIPPRQPVNGTASARVESAYGLPPLPQGDQPPDIDATGALVSLHQAATHSGPDSFPVLKAFQEYLESERLRARRRVALVTSLFAGIVVVLIAVFLAAGILLFNFMKEREERLWHRLESQTAAVVQPAAAPAPTASAALEREMQRLGEALAALTRERSAAREVPPTASAAPAAREVPPTASAAPAAPAAAVPSTGTAGYAVSAGTAVPGATAGATVSAVPTPAASVAVAAAPAVTTAAPAPAAVPSSAAAPAVASVSAVAASPRRAALEIPAGVTPPAPPAGFATSAIYLRPGGRGAPIPWNVYVPAP